MDQTLSGLQALQGKEGELSDKEFAQLKKAAQDFESIFIAQILKNMRKSVPEGGLFGNDMAGEFYTGMFDENIAKTIAGKGGLQIADTLINSLGNKQRGGLTGLTLADYNLRPIRKPAKSTRSPEWDRSIINDAARKYHLDPKLVEAVIKVESANNPNAVSDKGAVGLMQLMEKTADSLGVRNRFDPKQNIFGGSKYLRMMLDRFGGNIEHALAAYNAGPNAVEEHGGMPPYKETQRYVQKVFTSYQAM